MTEDQIEDLMFKVISEFEKLRDGHRLESAYLDKSLMPYLYKQHKVMHDSKAAAYDFVVRKLKRTFNLVNHE